MKEIIAKKINQYIQKNPDNYSSIVNGYYYEFPMIRYADAEDSIFSEFKQIIGEKHYTPKEAFEKAFGQSSFKGRSVISIALPLSEAIRKSNYKEKMWPSKEWILTRSYADEIFLKKLMIYTESIFTEMGHNAVAPWAADWFKVSKNGSTFISSWSERHIAYAAGHGSFGINSGLITNRGIAVKFVSVVTDAKFPADIRTSAHYRENCLNLYNGKCGACIKRCPVGAITEDGFNRMKCMLRLNGLGAKLKIAQAGGNLLVNSGCGLCRTNVPCEFKNPMYT